MLEILTGILAALNTIIAIGGAATVILKKPKQFIQKLFKASIQENLDEVVELCNSINSKLDLTEEATKCGLRHSITKFYQEHFDKKQLSSYQLEDIIHLYESYQSLGGNSYVHELVDEIKTWEVIK